jgi:L-asparagine transporter-like permease
VHDQELIKQRVRYLIEHGGIYPQRSRSHWLPAIVVICAVAAIELLQLLL